MQLYCYYYITMLLLNSLKFIFKTSNDFQSYMWLFSIYDFVFFFFLYFCLACLFVILPSFRIILVCVIVYVLIVSYFLRRVSVFVVSVRLTEDWRASNRVLISLTLRSISGSVCMCVIMGDVIDLDRQIEQLRRCELIKENEVKALCAKAR